MYGVSVKDASDGRLSQATTKYHFTIVQNVHDHIMNMPPNAILDH